MYLTLYDLFLLLPVALVALLFWQNAGLRDRALGLARQHCDKMGVQLLDDSVALVSLRPRRGRRSLLALARRYEFEFTATGERRYRGELTLLGAQLQGIELAPHSIN